MGRRLHVLLPGLLLMVGLVACSDEPRPGPPSVEPTQRRVVSLAPSITRMLITLGLADQVVAVADYDTFQREGVPSVGNYLDLNAERLVAVRPTHVFMMTGKEGVPAQLERLRDELGFELHAYPSPRTMEESLDILARGASTTSGMTLGAPDTIGGALGRERAEDGEVAVAARQLMDKSLDVVRQAGAQQAGDATPPRVLILLSTGPMMASGPRTPNGELIALIHADNAAGDATVSAPVFDKEKLIAAAPDVIVLMEPRAAEPAVQRVDVPTDPRFATLRGLPVDAVTQQRVYVLSDPHALLPGIDSPRIAAYLFQAVYGDDRLVTLMEQSFSP